MGGREKDYEHLGVEGALIIDKGKRGRRTERERAHTQQSGSHKKTLPQKQ